jgi:hypothetical protein
MDLLEKMSDAHAFYITLSDRAKCECAICKANKLTRGSVPQEREQSGPAPKLFERVCTNVEGKVTPDFEGNVYMVTFTCELTRWSMVYSCMQKSQVKVRFKNGRVLSDFQKFCVEQFIDHLLIAPQTSAQNGGSERLNRMLVEHAACITHEASPARELSRVWLLLI